MLVVTRPFENYREEQQALNRVGRNGDKCTRIKAFEGDIVDALASQESFARLIAFRNEHVVKKSSLQMAKLKPQTQRLREVKADSKLQMS